MSIIERGNTYYLRRRVPRRYQSVETRNTVWISLHTDSESLAGTKAGKLWEQLTESWEARLAGANAEAEERFAAAHEIARVRGFRYLDADAVSRLPVEDILERVEAVPDIKGPPDEAEATALLGTVPKPKIKLEDALEEYWSLARDKTIGKSPDQLRRWKNPRKRAVRNFVRVNDNKPMDEITRDDMLDFRQFWLERIESGEVEPGTANKDFIHLGDVLKTVNRLKRLGLDLPLGELSFKEGEQRTRPPFSVTWIRDRILAPGALDGMNADARGLLLGMVNTGYRPSEGVALTEETIRLDHEVPHISVEADGRQLKSKYARRLIPLTGVSLEAFKAFPGGFPRYRDSASLSATVNSFLRENGLLESDRHTFYSLRHSFEDRMIEAGIDDRIRRDVFGHRLNRERYGKGASLEHVARLLEGIAL